MPLATQTERFEALKEEEAGKRIQARAEVAQKFRADADGEGGGAESLAELEPMVTLSRLCEPREFSGLRPVEFTFKECE